MALKQYKPTSPARRGLVLVDKSALYKGKPVKSLTKGKTKTGGRNNKGHVTSRGIGGGHKQKYRLVDFKRRKWDVEGTIERIEYDPNRTAYIALVKYDDGELAYIIAPQRVAPGDKVVAGPAIPNLILSQLPQAMAERNLARFPKALGRPTAAKTERSVEEVYTHATRASEDDYESCGCSSENRTEPQY